MPLTSMKIKKKEKEDSLVGDSPFGFGLSIFIDDDRMEKLGFDKPLPAGTIVSMEAKGVVETSTESTDKDGKSVSMNIQITDLSVDPEGTDIANVLFGNQTKEN